MAPLLNSLKRSFHASHSPLLRSSLTSGVKGAIKNYNPSSQKKAPIRRPGIVKHSMEEPRKKKLPLSQKMYQRSGGGITRDGDSYVINKSKVKEWKVTRLTNGTTIHFSYGDYKGNSIPNNLTKASTWSKHLLHTPLVFNDAVKKMQKHFKIQIHYIL